MQIYKFPFESVRRDSKIVIYGAGAVGQTYLNQVSLTKYCSVVGIIDKNYARYAGLNCPVLPPSALNSLDYETIIIANASPTVASEIKNTLVNEYNIASENIIYENLYIASTPVISDTRSFIPESELAFSKLGKYAIGVNLDGGIGDYIIRKNNIKELGLWDSDVFIDIYVNKGNAEFARNLLCDIPNINRIIDTNSEYYAMQKEYLAAFDFAPILSLDFINTNELSNVSPTLSNNLKKIREIYVAYGLPADGISIPIHYMRCEKDGLNCYTAYNRYKAFNVTDFRTTIPLVPDYEKVFERLKLSRYITLNYGWNKTKGLVKPPAKVWPLEYFSELAYMIKRRFPQITLVQLGTKSSKKIENCDKYIFGENIELIKYILRDSALHIDCEGGLVHLATQLGTKCVVMFGPTPVKYYGYDVNINIVSEKCQNCVWLVTDYCSCYKGMEKPECMYSILPRIVMQNVEAYMSKQIL